MPSSSSSQPPFCYCIKLSSLSLAMAKLYWLGITLILLAIAYQYRKEIQAQIQTLVQKSSSSPASPKRGSSASEASTAGQKKKSERSPKSDTQESKATDSDQEEKVEKPIPDYYNPPFDPDNPPEPVYSKAGTRMITLNELAAHGHSGQLKPIWLAIMGRVYDVDKGAEHYYGPNGGYKFFTGRDGTRAFVTGEFNDEGLIDDVEGLTALQHGELQDWVKFYDKDYTFVGKLIGRYNTKEGSPTKYWYKFMKKVGEKEKYLAEQKELEKQFPGCNSRWNQDEGGVVYCSEKSGGVHRDWVGYPRRFFAPGSKSWRCACIHERDLNSPHIKPYPNCEELTVECKVNPDQLAKLRETGG